MRIVRRRHGVYCCKGQGQQGRLLLIYEYNRIYLNVMVNVRWVEEQNVHAPLYLVVHSINLHTYNAQEHTRSHAHMRREGGAHTMPRCYMKSQYGCGHRVIKSVP